MGGIVAVVLLVALFAFALTRLVKSWRTTTRAWGDGTRQGDGEGEGS